MLTTFFGNRVVLVNDVMPHQRTDSAVHSQYTAQFSLLELSCDKLLNQHDFR